MPQLYDDSVDAMVEVSQQKYDQHMAEQNRGNNDYALQIQLSKERAAEAQRASEIAQFGRVLTARERETGIIKPTWDSPLDQETMSLGEDLTIQNNYNPQYMQNVSDFVDSTDVSPWAQMLLDRQGVEEQQALEDAQAQSMQGMAGARAQLAMRGGLRSGARERIEQFGQENLLGAQQQVRRSGELGRSDILGREEANKMSLMAELPGMEFNRAQLDAATQETNIGNVLDQNRLLNEAQLRQYEADQRAWAAQQQGAAQRASGGGCFTGESLVTMMDGSMKRIDQLGLGDETLGGKIYHLNITELNEQDVIFNYHGTNVTGNHAVMEDEKWIRVKDSRVAKEIPIVSSKVYNFGCDAHFIVIGDSLFGDFYEVDDPTLSNDESLKIMNELWNRSKECSQSI